MAQATDLPTTSRFHNLSNAALADALGHADASLKGAEAECKALKDEIKRRGLLEAAGDSFATSGSRSKSPAGSMLRRSSITSAIPGGASRSPRSRPSYASRP